MSFRGDVRSMALDEVFVPKKPSGDGAEDEQQPLGQAPVLRPALMEPDVLRRTGAGELALLPSREAYGREQKVANQLKKVVKLAKVMKKLQM